MPPTVQELARRLDHVRFKNKKPALTGHPDGRLSAGENMTWVRTDTDREPVAVFGTVSATNIPIWIEEQPDGSYTIAKPDYIKGTVAYGSALETVTQPIIVPISNGNSVVIPSQNMDAGRLIPSPNGSLYVRITPFHYPGGYWDGFTDIAVVPPPGTLNHRIALVGIDRQSGEGTVTYGHPYSIVSQLQESEAAGMAIATLNANWRGWLNVRGGQNTLTTSVFHDARWFAPGVYQGTNGTLDGYAGLVPPAEATDINKFLRGDGTWNTLSVSNTAYSPDESAHWGSVAPDDVAEALDLSASNTALISLDLGIAVGRTSQYTEYNYTGGSLTHKAVYPSPAKAGTLQTVDYTYNPDRTLGTIVLTNVQTGAVVTRHITWTSGTLVSINETRA